MLLDFCCSRFREGSPPLAPKQMPVACATERRHDQSVDTTPPNRDVPSRLKPGVDYPVDERGLIELFRPDVDARRSLKRFTGWPKGITCPRCKTALKCLGKDLFLASCSEHSCCYNVTLTEKSLFHGVKAGLRVWIEAAWYIAENGKSGWSIPGLAERMVISPGLARACLAQYRRVMGTCNRDPIEGRIVYGTTNLSLTEKRQEEGSRQEVQVLMVLAVPGPEIRGQLRLRVLGSGKDGTALTDSLQSIAPGAEVITVETAKKAEVTLGSRRLADIKRDLNRWIRTLHGDAIHAIHLQPYLDEYCFFHNQKRGTPPGVIFRKLIELAMNTPPIKRKPPKQAGPVNSVSAGSSLEGS